MTPSAACRIADIVWGDAPLSTAGHPLYASNLVHVGRLTGTGSRDDETIGTATTQRLSSQRLDAVGPRGNRVLHADIGHDGRGLLVQLSSVSRQLSRPPLNQALIGPGRSGEHIDSNEVGLSGCRDPQCRVPVISEDIDPDGCES